MNKLFPIVFCVAGLALLAFGSRGLIDGYASSGWPKTEGVITESRLAQTGSGGKNHKKGLKAVIGYSYVVEGEQYASDQIHFGMSSYGTMLKSKRQRAYDWLEKYPVNKRVTVAYKPTDPGQGTLNTGAHYTVWIAPAMGLLFLAAGILVMRTGKEASPAKSSTDH